MTLLNKAGRRRSARFQPQIGCVIENSRYRDGSRCWCVGVIRWSVQSRIRRRETRGGQHQAAYSGSPAGIRLAGMGR